MIVVDTNIIAYLLLGGPMLSQAEQVYRKDPDWFAPPLWQSEFRNILAGMMRAKRLDLAGALEYWREAETLVGAPEGIDGSEVLRLAYGSGCTAYDCEFVALARRLGTPLVTADAQVLRAFPDTAVDMQAFLAA